MTLPAPYPPLVSGGDGLERYPAAPAALAARMGALYGVAADQVLATRGLTHGLELVWRLAARDGLKVQAPEAEPYRGLAALYARPAENAETAAVVIRALGSPEAVAEMAARVAPALLVVDEGLVEFAESPSAATVVKDHANLIVLRSLSLAYGLAGARVGAAVGQAPTLARLASVLEPYALPEVSVRLASQALDPSRMIETAARIDGVKRERTRVAEALSRLMALEAEVGPVIVAKPSDPAGVVEALRRFGLSAEATGERVCLPVSLKPEINDRLLTALGAAVPNARRSRVGQAVRDTRETRIVCAVDLDSAGPVKIHTGVGFFDHMIEQVAAHGGFSVRLACEGDLHIDPHHTIEDCAIALGQALKQALGERRGIGRYGFVLPMDEAEAAVSIDLSGRPYPVFEGTFATPMLGGYRTDLTAHVVRSLAENLGAAIHVRVTGDDDHHKTEAVFKALGRALRQAIRVEGDVVPSTKGVL